MTSVLDNEAAADGKGHGTHLNLALPVFNDDFIAAAKAASVDEILHGAMENACVKKDYGRREMLKELPDADGLRALAGRIKAHTLDHLDYYLEQLEANILKAGGHVHWAATGEEANAIIVEIARKSRSKLVVKSKSMVSEETELNHALIAAGIEPVETDLGELIVQLSHDHPSHLVMPIIHMRAKQVGEVFAKFFGVPFTEDPQALAEMARVYLRNRFNQADMGISGVNFAVAETGSICLCTNEGNGRMCTSRPRVHVALMGMEKLIPRFADLPVFVKLLARSASGQSLTQYTNIITGPRRPGEHDGPEEFHLVIMDNGRARILASEYRDTLRCIRCGACLNACPIYRTVGGHAYGSVYPGPIGALITPLFNGLEHHAHLPQATSLCGACYEACPVKINIPEMLIAMKGDLKLVGKTPWWEKMIFRLWTMGLANKAAYVLGQRMQRFAMRRLFRSKDGWITKLPGPAKGWTQARDFPRPPQKSFRELWAQRAGKNLQSRDPKGAVFPAHDASAPGSAGGSAHPPRGAQVSTKSRTNPFTHRAPLKGGGREVFLARVRRALGHQGISPAPSEPAPQRDETLLRQVQPDDTGRIERWITRAKANTMTVHRTPADLAAVTAAIDKALAAPAIRKVLLNAGQWDAHFGIASHLTTRDIEVVQWGIQNCAQAAFGCDAAITDCRAGLADAGSILVWSDPAFGRSTTLVVPLHIILLPTSRILPDMIDGLEMVRRESAATTLPSNVVIINGPSKTADIEMNLVTGVHGPKFLHVIVIDGI